MVEFIENVTDLEVSEFIQWMEELALKAKNLIRMECGQHINYSSEQSLSKVSPGATFHDFVSVWEYKNGLDIEKFISEPFHAEMAKSKFKKIVAHRHVVNF